MSSMRYILIIILSLVLFSIELVSSLEITEVCGRNHSSWIDNDNQDPDWIELFNNSDQSIDLSNYYITDKLNESLFRLSGALKANERIILIADSKNRIDSTSIILMSNGYALREWNSVDEFSYLYRKISGDFSIQLKIDSFYDTGIHANTGILIRNELSDDSDFISFVHEVREKEIATIYYRDSENYPKRIDIDYNIDMNDYKLYLERKGDSILFELRDLGNYAIRRSSLKLDLLDDLFIGVQSNSFDKDLISKSVISELLINGSEQDLFDMEHININCDDFELQRENEIHLDFSISENDTIYLYRNDVLIDQLKNELLRPDYTINKEDGELFYSYASPLMKSEEKFIDKLSRVNIIADNSFINDSKTVSMTSDENATIYYSTDHSKPNLNSSIYSNPLILDSTTTIKAIAIKDGYIDSEINSRSFFLKKYELPVVSISADDELLFGQFGILLDTRWWDKAEVEAEIEFYSKDLDLQFNRSINIKRNGNYGSLIVKPYSLRLMSSSAYLQNNFKGDLFELDRSIDDLIIRNAGNDFQFLYMRDALISIYASKFSDLIYSAYQPYIYYLNGRYQGVGNIREFIDDEMISHLFDVNRVDLIENVNNIKSGRISELIKDLDLIIDMTDDIYYEMNKRFDLNNIYQYLLFQLYFNNTDWPHNNVLVYRHERDPKWNFIVKDFDWSIAIDDQSDYFSNKYLKLNDYEKPYSKLFIKVLNNKTFRDEFLNYTCDRFNTDLNEDNMHEIFDSLSNQIKNEIVSHKIYWDQDTSLFNSSVQKVKDFLNNRRDHFIGQTSQYFDLNGISKLNFDLNIPKAFVNVNSISYSGKELIYFQDIPTNIKVMPHEGYVINDIYINGKKVDNNTFTFIPDSLHTNISINLERVNTTEQAIIINEIQFENSDNGPRDWVELYNRSVNDVDVSNWFLIDENNDNERFYLPENTILEGKKFLVITRDSLKFKEYFNYRYNLIGDFDFGFGSEDQIRLYDDQNTMVDKVSYSNVEPWPIISENDDQSIELINPFLDNSVAYNWKIALNPTPGEVNSNHSTVSISNDPKEDIIIDQDNNIIRIRCFNDLCVNRIELYDLRGSLIQRSQYSSQKSIDIPIYDLPKAVYLIMIESSKGLITKRVLVQ